MNRFVTLISIAIITAASSLSSFAASDSSDYTQSGWNHFVWGAEVGGAIDMTSNNLSSLNLDAYFGYKNSWINALGVGASVNMMVSNSVRAFPVYAMLRTDFSSQKKLLFMDLRGGVAFNNLTYGSSQTSLYLSPGIGINLASSKTFNSYITLSYIYNGLKPFNLGDRHCDVDGLSMACLRLGISF
ncbi:MAG: hypothetical protein NC338_04600 [Firmicutes bacterium]|nr:hypothetical protein [Bacillota bacterium]MCM1401149.1 hypothetical protein [Bacteroides sp.]MCM1477028.1 hypothetical protein [Bacteroides sp.]